MLRYKYEWLLLVFVNAIICWKAPQGSATYTTLPHNSFFLYFHYQVSVSPYQCYFPIKSAYDFSPSRYLDLEAILLEYPSSVNYA